MRRWICRPVTLKRSPQLRKSVTAAVICCNRIMAVEEMSYRERHRTFVLVITDSVLIQFLPYTSNGSVTSRRREWHQSIPNRLLNRRRRWKTVNRILEEKIQTVLVREAITVAFVLVIVSGMIHLEG